MVARWPEESEVARRSGLTAMDWPTRDDVGESPAAGHIEAIDRESSGKGTVIECQFTGHV